MKMCQCVFCKSIASQLTRYKWRSLLMCFWVCIILCLCFLIWTYVVGLWTFDVVFEEVGYSPYVEQKKYSFLPSIVLKRKPLKHAETDSNHYTDLISLMKDLHLQNFTNIEIPPCEEFFNGNETAIKIGIIHEKIHARPKLSDRKFIQMTESCENYLQHRHYQRQPVSQMEKDFPIAFSILAFEDAEQFEMLLRAIYRPQNYYCVHIDTKSSQAFTSALRAIARCFSNVFIASRLTDVRWGTYSVVQPEITCMEDLWKYPAWKYFINLTGKEYPLKSNLDLVKILQAFNGANNCEGTLIGINHERTDYVYNGSKMTNIRKPPPPVPITLVKGSAHITASRAFVDYVLHDPRAVTFREWVKDTGIPDETFFASLGHSPQMGVPGAYAGRPETNPDIYPFFTRFKNWGSFPFDYPCYGMRLRRICIFGIGDLPLLGKRREMFANKFHLAFQPKTLQCLEERLLNMTKGDILGSRHFDASPYSNFDFVRNHV